MRRFLGQWAGLAVLVLIVGTMMPGQLMGAQDSRDSKDATIASLQTRVAELETRTVGSPTTPPASASPISAQQSAVYGNAKDLLPAGESGKLAIVASGPYQKGSVAVVLRNNTADVLGSIDISGDVRDANGHVTQTVDGLQFYPIVVRPGDLVLGQVYFEQPVAPTDRVSLKVQSDADTEFATQRGFVPLQLVEFNHIEDRVTGSVRNPSNKPTTDRGYIILICFDASDKPSWSDIGSVDKGIAPRDVAAFEFGKFSGIPVSCDHYLFAGYSYTG